MNNESIYSKRTTAYKLESARLQAIAQKSFDESVKRGPVFWEPKNVKNESILQRKTISIGGFQVPE